jgi:hypothetical protein
MAWHDRKVPSYLRALTELFDASVTDIVDAAQPRTFDREGIRLAADIWHNNILDMYAAVMAQTRRRQEALAREVLERMVTLRPGHRNWYRRLGVPEEILLSLPSRDPIGPWRDSMGRVMHPEATMTAAGVAEISEDYDVAGALLSQVAVDHRRGSTEAVATLSARRRFAVTEGSESAAQIKVRLKDVDEVEFDSQGVTGIELHADPGVVIAAGAGTRIRAQRAKLWIHDREWHRSGAGERADLTARRGVRPPDAGRGRGHELTEEVTAVARQIYHVMLQIRVVGGAPAYGYSEIALRHARSLTGLGAALAACAELPRRRRHKAVLAISKHATATAKGVAPPIYAEAESSLPRHLGWSVASVPGQGDRFDVVEAIDDPAAGWVTRPREWESATRVRFTPTSYEVE